MNNINDITSSISDMFQFFNKELEAGLPDNVVFALIPNQGRSSYLGWFARSRWEKGEERLHEINIASDHLNRPVEQIAETIVHEMVHLKNFLADIKDCTRTQYHNKAFKTQAEAFGLKVERMKNKGYALTSLDEKAKAMVDKYQTEVLKGANPFVIHRITEPKGGGGGNKDKKMVAINRDLAGEIVGASGMKLGPAVDQILREWIESHG